MSARRNEGRFEAPPSGIPEEVFEQINAVEAAEKQVDNEAGASPASSLFSFTMPTEFVELPSKGLYYTEGHPLHLSDTIEIKYMTAKDEDILTSPALVKKGVAIDRMIQNIIVDKRIKVEELLVGDKNALVVAARSSGYGSEYATQVTCPRCGTTGVYAFDLQDKQLSIGGVEAVDMDGESIEVEKTNDGTFMVELPKMKVKVELKLMTGKEEKVISKLLNSSRKEDSLLTTQLKTFIVSANGHTQRRAIELLVHSMPASDSRFLRKIYQQLAPNVDLTQHYECGSCGYEQDMEVPFNADFFWPRS